jgi:hypothetical protein
MSAHDPAHAVEVAVDVAQRASNHALGIVAAGTSRSFLSQMKSLLL